LAERLTAIASAHPEGHFVMGQAVYAWTKGGRSFDALNLAEQCAGEGWWCGLLRGSVYHRAGNLQQSEVHFREALKQAPAEFLCSVEDLGFVLDGDLRSKYRNRSCEGRRAIADSVWWLGDPLYALPGNDRWAEHVNRKVELILHNDLLDAIGSEHPVWHQIQVERRGFEDSWERRSDGGLRIWTSVTAAAFHFLPEWNERRKIYEFRLDAMPDDEGYTPPYRPVWSLPRQIIRLLESDSLAVAVAADLRGHPLEAAPGRVSHLVVSDGPGSFPLRLGSEDPRPLTVFLARVGARPHVVSLEVICEEGVGRSREIVRPFDGADNRLSDLLVYHPRGNMDSVSRAEAVGLMAGSTTLPRGSELGLYWEVYTNRANDTITLSLAPAETGSGVLATLEDIVGLRGESDATGRVTWRQPVKRPVSPHTIALRVGALDPGEYEVVVTAEDTRGRISTRTRRITFEK
jgi:hypothetical protein